MMATAYARPNRRSVQVEGLGGKRSFSRARIADAVEVLVALLDVTEPDSDAEHDPFNEGEPVFDLASRELVNRHGDGAGCTINGDAEEEHEDDPLDKGELGDCFGLHC
jgi:hypothetical protein